MILEDMTGAAFTVGDRVVFARPRGGNSKGGILDIGTVEKIFPQTMSVTLRLDNGRAVSTPYKSDKFYKTG